MTYSYNDEKFSSTMQEKVSNAHNIVISGYITLVEFLGKFIDPHCEVVLCMI